MKRIIPGIYLLLALLCITYAMMRAPYHTDRRPLPKTTTIEERTPAIRQKAYSSDDDIPSLIEIDMTRPTINRTSFGSGTAYAINRSGYWLTARHVTEGCQRIYLEIHPNSPFIRQAQTLSLNSQSFRVIPAHLVAADDYGDHALLKTSISVSTPLALASNKIPLKID